MTVGPTLRVTEIFSVRLVLEEYVVKVILTLSKRAVSNDTGLLSISADE